MSDFPQRIVYIDDEQDFRLLVRDALETSGYDGAFASCGSGKEFLNMLRVLQPELVLLDLKLPDMDGPAILKALYDHEDAKDVPVIFCTGAAKIEMLDQYQALNVIGVIHKPYNFDTFYADVKKLWVAYQSDENVQDDPED